MPHHAVFYGGARDVNGVGVQGTVHVEWYHAAPGGTRDIDENNNGILDVWAGECGIDDKSISLETAAALLGWPVGGFIQRGRQKAAQDEDELDEELERLIARRRRGSDDA